VGIALVLWVSPWLVLAEPFLTRVLKWLSNAAGKEAVTAIAKEVEQEEGRRRLVASLGSQIEPMLRDLLAKAGEQTAESLSVRPLRPNPLPSELLVAAHQATVYVGRDALLGSLDEWAGGDDLTGLGL
jgi:hypothetical protein